MKQSDTNSIDWGRLYYLGFSDCEIQFLQMIQLNGYKPTTTVLNRMNLTYKDIIRIQYLYNILQGREIILDTTEDLSKHFRKMNYGRGRIGINDLPPSTITNVPRLAVISGIPKGNYQIYNSNNKEMRVYPVIETNESRIMIRTRKKPVLPYGSEKKLYYIKDMKRNHTYYTEDEAKIKPQLKNNQNVEIDIVLEIKKLTKDKRGVEVAIHRDYIRLINRFIVICSFRKPEFHMGVYEIVAWEGTRLYVYCTYMGKGETVNYNNSVQRVYGWGYKKDDISFTLKKVAQRIYQGLNGVFVNEVPANMDFVLFEK